MDISTYRKLPVDHQNEQNLLSCVLQDPSLIRSLNIEHSLFQLQSLKKVFGIVADMEEEQKEISLPSVWDRVKNTGIFKDFLDFECLWLTATTTQNASYYHKKLADNLLAREILMAVSSIQDKASEGEDPESLINLIVALLDRTAIGQDETQEIVTAGDIKKTVMERYENPVKRGFSTGWMALDPFYTVVPGELTIVTGIPNHGKSSWTSHLMVHLAEIHDWRIGLFSPENHPMDLFVSRLLPLFVRKPFTEGMSPRMSRMELDDGIAWLERQFVFLDPINPTIDRILGLALRAHKKSELRALVIDPWNEVQHPNSSHLSEPHYIREMLTKIRKFGRRYKIHMFIVAHPMKLQKDKQGGYPIPTPYDISGAAHWRNQADNCITVWRDLSPDTDSRGTQIHIQKIRFDDAGRLGTVELYFDGVTRRYRDP